MRADRLLSLVMLLQNRGKITARELASELEVSERTIHRDIDALSAAGIPVYAEQGRAGGFFLLDSYRSNLTGLTEGELQALFMLNTPGPLAKLGMERELRQALLKFSAALPISRRSVEVEVRQRFYLDSNWWEQTEDPVPYLQTIHEAVWQDRKIYLTYRPLYNVELEQLVDPYGLVAKAGAWYLVCASNQQIHVLRVSRLLHARLSDETFFRPTGFNLKLFWQEWCRKRADARTNYAVTVRVRYSLLPLLPSYFGERVRKKIDQAEPASEDGWMYLELTFDSLETARDRLLGFGNAVEVIAPKALRKSLVDYAKQIVSLYYWEDSTG